MYNGYYYINIQFFVVEMKIGVKDIFFSVYQGKGVCSWDIKNIYYVNNLWMFMVSVYEDGKDKMFFCGICYGVFFFYYEKDLFLCQVGVENKVKEVLIVVFYSKFELFNRVLEGEVVSFKLVFVGLFIVLNIFGKEGIMVED